MQDLTTSTANQSIAVIKPQELCKQLFQVNQLVSFPVNDLILEDWSATLTRLAPTATAAELQTVFDKFMTNKCKWNDKQGIQNIFRGLELLKLEPGEYYCEEKKMKYRNYGSLEQGNKRRIYENDKEF